MTQHIPLVDLKAQHDSMKADLESAIAGVLEEAAFVGTPQNRFVKAFESEFAEYAQRDHCIACGNGTDSLEILLQAAGVGSGDEVLVPAMSWIATSEAVTSTGATPVFVDILRDEYTMDPADAAAKLTSRTKALIPVHLYGNPARMDLLGELAARHGLFLLEDCAQAHGAAFQGRQVGTFGDAASFSFFPSKNLGAIGDAGAMVTNDSALANRARLIAQHGQGAKKHDHQIEGRNSRMDGIQAAVLSAKLRRLPAWTETRRLLAAGYRSALGGVVERMQVISPDAQSVYHLFVVEVAERADLMQTLAEAGIATAVQYPTPLPLLQAYASHGHSREDFKNASEVSARILSLPLYPELTPEQHNYVISSVRRALGRAVSA